MTNLYSWQQSDWRDFSFDAAQLAGFEAQFLHFSGVAVGIQKALSQAEKEQIKITLLSDEALGTAEIEGEILDRASVQSSIQRYFNLKAAIDKNRPRENGIAQMMVDLYRHFDAPLSHNMLFAWHQMLMNGRTDLEAIGTYRFHNEPMQLVSGHIGKTTVHYQAPPSEAVQGEMDIFIDWFNTRSKQLSPLIRAGIVHAYFELIHPFEDGNGRIGRALVEKCLAQSLGQPTFIAVSQTMLHARRAYYAAFETVNKSNELTGWLHYFCQTIIEAQQFTIASIELFIQKAHFFERYESVLNTRQQKLLRRIFQENLKGFTGGVSVKNYISITKTSPATANRDLNDLVAKGILVRTGQRKATRYWLVDLAQL